MTFAHASTTTLDEAFERLSAAGFELPNGFVNHGPMACEALDALGYDREVDQWARRFSRAGGTPIESAAPSGWIWWEALGDRRRLPEWVGLMERAIDDQGWEATVGRWVPRLVPAASTALFHALIRTGHAVRALAASNTAPRRAELARALGYWAARYQPGAEAGDSQEMAPADARLAVADAAADAARRYLVRPGIVELHGITGAMGIELLVPYLSAEAAGAAVTQIRAEHARLYGSLAPVEHPELIGIDPIDLVEAAVRSHDPHQVKLVEACLRGADLTDDQAFLAAAEVVTG